MLRVLERHHVDYVLIGGLAATLHGSPLRTGDADICPGAELDNLERLAAALTETGAKIRYDLEGLLVPVASLADIIRSKEAADRDKD